MLSFADSVRTDTDDVFSAECTLVNAGRSNPNVPFRIADRQISAGHGRKSFVIYPLHKHDDLVCWMDMLFSNRCSSRIVIFSPSNWPRMARPLLAPRSNASKLRIISQRLSNNVGQTSACPVDKLSGYSCTSGRRRRRRGSPGPPCPCRTRSTLPDGRYPAPEHCAYKRGCAASSRA